MVAAVYGTVSLGVLDNDPLSLQVLSDDFREEFGQDAVVWSTTEVEEAVTYCMREAECPQVLVLDMSLSSIDGVRVCRQIRRQLPVPAIVGVTSYEPWKYERDLADAGAQALVRKSEMKSIVRAVQAVRDGGPYPSGSAFLPAYDAYRRLSAYGSDPLFQFTPQEQRVLDAMAFGLDNRAVAESLGIQVSTVKTHLHNAMQKLGVHSRGLAATMWNAMRSQDGAEV